MPAGLRRAAVVVLSAASSMLGTDLARSATMACDVDGLFERWGLEGYRLRRSPDEPSGSLLPLPLRPADCVGFAFRSVTLQSYLASGDVRQTVEEADGLSLGAGVRAATHVSGDAAMGRRLQGDFGMRILAGDGSRDPVAVLRANLVYRTRRVEALVGRVPAFLGDGSEGSLLLGRTATPLDMLCVRTVRPVLVAPGDHGWGRVHGLVFLGFLHERDRTIPNPLLHGLRLEWEPASYIRVGASRTILFGGEGRTEKLGLQDVVDILLGRNENKVTGRDYRDSDQKASLHSEVRLPAAWHGARWLGGARLFYEYAGEDNFRRGLPTAVAHHQGGSVGVLGWTVLLESAELVDDSYDWYTHMVYGPDAYRYQGFTMGHPAGTDGRSVHVRIWSPCLGSHQAQVYWKRRSIDPRDETTVSRTTIAGASGLHRLAASLHLEWHTEVATGNRSGSVRTTEETLWTLIAQVHWTRSPLTDARNPW